MHLRHVTIVLTLGLMIGLASCAENEEPLGVVRYRIGYPSFSLDPNLSSSPGIGQRGLNKEAHVNWRIKHVQIAANGEFDLNLEVHYDSLPPVEEPFGGTGLFLEIYAMYEFVDSSEGYGYGHLEPLLWKQMFIEPVHSTRIEQDLHGHFTMPEPAYENLALAHLSFGFSWVRMYTGYDTFFEWGSSRNAVEPEILVGQIYQDIRSEFDVFEPIPSLETGTLSIPIRLDPDSDGFFNYAYWMINQSPVKSRLHVLSQREHLPGKEHTPR